MTVTILCFRTFESRI